MPSMKMRVAAISLVFFVMQAAFGQESESKSDSEAEAESTSQSGYEDLHESGHSGFA